jgi:hypothetical protein
MAEASRARQLIRTTLHIVRPASGAQGDALLQVHPGVADLELHLLALPITCSGGTPKTCLNVW